MLKKVDLRITDDCPFGGFQEDTTLCVRGDTGKGTCVGDSGGPLVVQANGVKVLVGLTSARQGSVGCGYGYGIYTKISHYLTWLSKFTDLRHLLV